MTYKSNKIIGKYLNSTDEFWEVVEILEKHPNVKLLNQFCEVHNGMTTGNDEFFYLDKEKIDKWGIEERFLRPIFNTHRFREKMRLEEKDCNKWLFFCYQNKEELKDTNALKYIYHGEDLGYGKKSPSWYYNIRTNAGTADTLLPSVINSKFGAYFMLPDHYSYDNAFLGLHLDLRGRYCHDGWTVYPYINSCVFMLLCEVLGDTSLGNGAKHVSIKDYNKMPVLYKSDRKIMIQTIWNKCLDSGKIRNMLNLNDEMQVIDIFICDELGINDDLRNRIYKTLNRLVSTRLKKAVS